MYASLESVDNSKWLHSMQYGTHRYKSSYTVRGSMLLNAAYSKHESMLLVTSWTFVYKNFAGWVHKLIHDIPNSCLQCLDTACMGIIVITLLLWCNYFSIHLYFGRNKYCNYGAGQYTSDSIISWYMHCSWSPLGEYQAVSAIW